MNTDPETGRHAMTPSTDAGPTSTLRGFISSARAEVDRGREPAATARAVAGHLERVLSEPDLLAPGHLEPGEDGYRQHVLHVEEDGSFSVVALVWLPGQETPIHDHVAWCVPGVYRGREEETRYRRVDDHLVEAGRGINGPGDVVALTPPGDIHRVRNPGPEKTVSIHVYGADVGELGSSIRRTYDLPVKGGG